MTPASQTHVLATLEETVSAFVQLLLLMPKHVEITIYVFAGEVQLLAVSKIF